MATIASLAVQLTADPKGLTSGLKRAEQALNRVGKSGFNPGAWATMASSGFGKIQGAVDSVVNPIKGLVSSIPLVGGALASFPTSVSGFFDWFKEGAERINNMRVVATRLGVSVEAISGIAAAGGGDAEKMARGMAHLSQKIAEAAAKAPGTEVEFRALGLSARDLVQMKGEDALRAVIGALHELGPGMNQAAKSADMFGERSNEAFMQLVSRGVPALDAAKAATQRLGMSVTGDQAEQVRLAMRSIKQVEMAMTGIKTQIAVAVAPIILALAENFDEVSVSAEKVGSAVLSGAKIIAYGGAYAIEIWRVVSETFHAAQIAYETMILGMVKMLAWLMRQAAKLPDSLGGNMFKGVAETLEGTFQNMLEDVKKDKDAWLEEFAQPGAIQDVDKFFEKFARKMDAARKKAAEGGGNNPAQNVLGAVLQKKGLELEQEMRNPLEKFRSRIDEMNQLIEAGAIKWDTYSRAVGQAAIELESVGVAQSHLAATANFGSQEAYKAVADAQFNATKADPMARLEDAINRLGEQAKRRTRNSDIVAEAAKKGFVVAGKIG